MSENKAIRNTVFGYNLENYKSKHHRMNRALSPVRFQVKFETVFSIKFNYSINSHLFSQN